MRLSEPWWLVLLAVAPLPWLFDRSRPRIAWPTLAGFRAKGGGLTRFRARLPSVLRAATIVCLAVAMARPQEVAGRTRIAGQGVALVVALDHSPSMNTPDTGADLGAGLAPNGQAATRLDVAKRTLGRFVAGRPDDLIGLVVFAKYPDLAAPPTLDHEFLRAAIAAVKPARPGDFGTNLGDALVWSLGALRDVSPSRKVLILLTDGRNNPGRTTPPPADPESTARLARELNVTLHTIAVGRAGSVSVVEAVEPRTRLPVVTEAEGPDFALLERLAKAGGGRAFVAEDAQALDQVMAAIDALEKSPVRGEIRTRYREAYAPWALAALGLVALDLWLAAGRYRRLP